MRSDDKTEDTDSKTYSDDPMKPTAADEIYLMILLTGVRLVI
jgi:hypothetical protein